LAALVARVERVGSLAWDAWVSGVASRWADRRLKKLVQVDRAGNSDVEPGAGKTLEARRGRQRCLVVHTDEADRASTGNVMNARF
jgi:hypothetical protein